MTFSLESDTVEIPVSDESFGISFFDLEIIDKTEASFHIYIHGGQILLIFLFLLGKVFRFDIVFLYSKRYRYIVKH